VEPRLEHPLAAVMRKVDLFVPLLTGEPTSKAADIVGGIVGAANSQSMTSDQGTSIILLRLLLLKNTRVKTADRKKALLDGWHRQFIGDVRAMTKRQCQP
jgi:hypothetical protein